MQGVETLVTETDGISLLVGLPGLEPLASSLSGTFGGIRSCWSGEDDQLVGGVDVTVVVRSWP
jgi:hypothetical protein